MSDHDKNKSRDQGFTYASRAPDLRKDVPKHFRQTPPIRHHFDHARDPYISAQLKDIEEREALQRQSGEGSQRIKSEKPYPELRPKYARTQKREIFGGNSLKEHRSAQLAAFKKQEIYRANEKSQQYEQEHPRYERNR